MGHKTAMVCAQKNWNDSTMHCPSKRRTKHIVNGDCANNTEWFNCSEQKRTCAQFWTRLFLRLPQFFRDWWCGHWMAKKENERTKPKHHQQNCANVIVSSLCHAEHTSTQTWQWPIDKVTTTPPVYIPNNKIASIIWLPGLENCHTYACNWHLSKFCDMTHRTQTSPTKLCKCHFVPHDLWDTPKDCNFVLLGFMVTLLVLQLYL